MNKSNITDSAKASTLLFPWDSAELLVDEAEPPFVELREDEPPLEFPALPVEFPLPPIELVAPLVELAVREEEGEGDGTDTDMEVLVPVLSSIN
jgi:hypothetical protein